MTAKTAIPVEELERVARLLRALANATHSNSEVVSFGAIPVVQGDVDRFVAICAEHGADITIPERERFHDVLTDYHGGTW